MTAPDEGLGRCVGADFLRGVFRFISRSSRIQSVPPGAQHHGREEDDHGNERDDDQGEEVEALHKAFDAIDSEASKHHPPTFPHS